MTGPGCRCPSFRSGCVIGDFFVSFGAARYDRFGSMGRVREGRAYEGKEEMSTGGHGKVGREGKVGRGGEIGGGLVIGKV